MGCYAFGRLAPHIGARFAATGVAYENAGEALACTLLGCRNGGHEGP